LWRLIHWNWPGLDYRLFRFCIETDRPDVGQRLEALQRAFQMGLKIRTADLRELLGIDGPAEGEEYVQDPNFRQQAPGQPPDLPNLSGPPLDTPEQFRERYSLPEGLPKNPQVGQTATIGGVTYQFNENRRWQRTDKPAEGSVFFSPNIAQTMSLEEAMKALESWEQQKAVALFRQAVESYSAKYPVQLKRVEGVLGEYPEPQPDGRELIVTENSIYAELELPPAGAEPLLEVLAAKAGLISEEIYGPGKAQKYVGYFLERPHAPWLRWQSVWHGSLENVRIALDQAGLTSRSIAPIPGERGQVWKVIIAGEAEPIRQQLAKLNQVVAKQSQIQVTPYESLDGILTFFGDADREQAARTYRRIIEEFRPWREKMSAQAQDLPGFLKHTWYLEEKPDWDAKTKTFARLMRYGYTVYMMSPEERAKWRERCRQLDEELVRMGMIPAEVRPEGTQPKASKPAASAVIS